MRKIVVLMMAATLLGACAMSGNRESSGADKSRGDKLMSDRETKGLPEPLAPRLATSIGMHDILALPHRSAENRARDAYRHPQETLAFFDVQPHQTVLEVTPGGGWYTEVLAPYLRANGMLITQIFDPASAAKPGTRDYYTRSNAEFRAKLAANPELYDRVRVIEAAVGTPTLGAPASVDRVLTFRNVHNWTSAGSDAAMFKAFFDVLKPNGVLGVVEHRAAPGTDPTVSAKTGYITESYVMKLASEAGFELIERSEINANPKDTRDYANGVWTLPPGLRVPEGEDKAKYQAIGESDRMTLKFVKPAR